MDASGSVRRDERKRKRAKRILAGTKLFQLKPSRPDANPKEFGAETEEERQQRILAGRLRDEAKWRPKVPETRKVNFDNFKNRYRGDQPDYAIDILVGTPNISDQIRKERAVRRQEELARLRRAYMSRWDPALGYFGHHSTRPQGSTGEKSRRSEKIYTAGQHDVSVNEAYIHRVRIQSQPVLAPLTRLLGVTEHRSRPRTFCRPFKPLVYFQPHMKKALDELIERYGHLENQQTEDRPGPEVVVEPAVSSAAHLAEVEDDRDHGSDNDDDDDDDDDRKSETDSESSLVTVESDDGNPDLVMDSIEALRDMRCYVDFVDREILPLYNQFDGCQSFKINFEDLWFLFRVGELVYMPAAGEAAQDYQELWRVYRIETPAPDYASPDANNGWQFTDDQDQEPRDREFTLSCYHIDHDGSAYGAVRHKFAIRSFSGERDIDSLEVYPIRFSSGHLDLLDELKKQGRDFQRYLEERHQAYNSWTLTRNPSSDMSDPQDTTLRDSDGNMMYHPQFVESHVVIDPTEALQANPQWRPSFHRPSTSKSISSHAEEDTLDIQQWADRSRSTCLYSTPEMIQTEDGVDLRRRRENLSLDHDRFLYQRTRDFRSYGRVLLISKLREDDIILLPKRMFAYALRDRKFVLVDITYLKPVVREEDVFERLKILRSYKDIVRGLVSSHFQKKELERGFVSMSTEGISQDLIQGKGKGLVILLHGVPGVGKTATAEAVAIENRKPLFVITCGDLGLTPTEVESSLTNVFRLAHLWDCVLLLDEADVFLSQRSRLDMKRNALVSIFLRVLEYYNGLLFLTTNRVGTMDEAFKSRIHISLYYEPLNRIQTEEIFRINISKLRRIGAQRAEMTKQPALDIREDDIIRFACIHYDRNRESRSSWNGRQIRNAFQIATGLAYHNYATMAEKARTTGSSPPTAPVLDDKTFAEVEEATQSFEDYMRRAKGWSDADLAHLLGERADHTNDYQPPRASAYPTQSQAGPTVPTSAFSNFSASQGGASYGQQYHDNGHGYGTGMGVSASRYDMSTSPNHHMHHGIPQHINRFSSGVEGQQAQHGPDNAYLSPHAPLRHDHNPQPGQATFYGVGSADEVSNTAGLVVNPMSQFEGQSTSAAGYKGPQPGGYPSGAGTEKYT